MAGVTQQQCNDIATKLNRRPRKRLGFKTRRSASMGERKYCASTLKLGARVEALEDAT